MTTAPAQTFHDGYTIPQIGLGVWKTPDDVAVDAVATALRSGYRHIDTAAIYGNENGVGEGMRQSGVERKDIFLTTKLWNEDQGYDSAFRALDASLDRLGTDYVDLYLIHAPSAFRGKYVESWKALIDIQKTGKARSIGVSNFTTGFLNEIIDATGVVPVINQIELHPKFQQRELRALHEKLGIITQSWSPLGQGQQLDNPVIAEIAKRYGKTPAQIIIRWHLDSGLNVIPKSVTASRIIENFAVFDFALDAEAMAAINALDDAGGRIGFDPATMTF
ncbi:aldo/keto reductase [Devosia sp. MC1541]|uniref:aldo/keto reductase n=1 Tax=Devosia sp. MC1541 TaxID=2725264 RepID=UPI00145D2966|nr:aldo/keto reductase [Devosia sp. MC1541]